MPRAPLAWLLVALLLAASASPASADTFTYTYLRASGVPSGLFSQLPISGSPNAIFVVKDCVDAACGAGTGTVGAIWVQKTWSGTAWVNTASAAAATNLTVSTTGVSVTVLSDTGLDAVLPAATGAAAGVMVAADKAKLDGVASGATVGLGADPAACPGGQFVTDQNQSGVLTCDTPAGGGGSGPTDLTQGTRTATTVVVESSTGTDATLSSASVTQAGVMPAADKVTVGLVGAVIRYADPTTPGTTTRGIQEAINACDSGVGGGEISPGCIVQASCDTDAMGGAGQLISSGIVVGGYSLVTAKSGVHLRGCGAGLKNGGGGDGQYTAGTTLRWNGSTPGRMISFLTCDHCSISGFTLDADHPTDNSKSATNALFLDSATGSPTGHFRARDVMIFRATDFAVYMNPESGSGVQQVDNAEFHTVSVYESGGCFKQTYQQDVNNHWVNGQCQFSGLQGFAVPEGSLHIHNTFVQAFSAGAWIYDVGGVAQLTIKLGDVESGYPDVGVLRVKRTGFSEVPDAIVVDGLKVNVQNTGIKCVEWDRSGTLVWINNRMMGNNAGANAGCSLEVTTTGVGFYQNADVISHGNTHRALYTAADFPSGTLDYEQLPWKNLDPTRVTVHQGSVRNIARQHSSPPTDTKTGLGSERRADDYAESWFAVDGVKGSGTTTKTVGREAQSVHLTRAEGFGSLSTLVAGGNVDAVNRGSETFCTGGSQDAADHGCTDTHATVTDVGGRAVATTVGTLFSGANTTTVPVSAGTLTVEESKWVGEDKLAVFESHASAATVTVVDAPPGTYVDGVLETDGTWLADGSGTGQGVWTLGAGQVQSAWTGYCFAAVDSDYVAADGTSAHVWLEIAAVNVGGNTITTKWRATGADSRTPFGYSSDEAAAAGLVAPCGVLGRPVFSSAIPDKVVDSLTFTTDAGFPGVANAPFTVNTYPPSVIVGSRVRVSNATGGAARALGYVAEARTGANTASPFTTYGRVAGSGAFVAQAPGFDSNQMKDGARHGWLYGLDCTTAPGCRAGWGWRGAHDPSDVDVTPQWAGEIGWDSEDWDDAFARVVLRVEHTNTNGSRPNLTLTKDLGWGQDGDRFMRASDKVYRSLDHFTIQLDSDNSQLANFTITDGLGAGVFLVQENGTAHVLGDLNVGGDMNFDGEVASGAEGDLEGGLGAWGGTGLEFFYRIKPPLTSAAGYTLRLPSTLGLPGQMLSTSGTGATDWVTPSTISDGSRGDIAITGGGTVWSISPDAVALGVDTTGGYAASATEAGAASSGDDAAGFFAAGLLDVDRGGNGSAPAAAGQVVVSAGTASAAWATIPDTDGGGLKLVFDAATRQFSSQADDDVPDAGEVSAAALAVGAVSGGPAGVVVDGSITAADLGTGSVTAADAAADMATQQELDDKTAATSAVSQVPRFSNTAGDIVPSTATIDASGNMVIPGALQAGAAGATCFLVRDRDNAGNSECTFLDGVISCRTDANGVCDGP